MTRIDRTETTEVQRIEPDPFADPVAYLASFGIESELIAHLVIDQAA